jgi:hypothetical protein
MVIQVMISSQAKLAEIILMVVLAMILYMVGLGETI